jgi:hypothetical protein
MWRVGANGKKGYALPVDIPALNGKVMRKSDHQQTLEDQHGSF